MGRLVALASLGLILAGAAGAALWKAAPSSPAKNAGSSVPPAADPNRITLDPAQVRQAIAAGGFQTPPVSLLRVDGAMRYGEFRWSEQGIPQGPVTIRVDLRTQILSVFRAGHEIGTAVILYGADKKETPLGTFPVLWKGRDHVSSLYDAPMPFTLRLTGDGVAIHGSNVRWGAATNGCIGAPTEFARLLFDEVKVGDKVTIVRSRASSARTSV